MFFKRKREGTDWEYVDEIYYLKRILNRQDEILETLKSIDNNIVKYLGEDYELKEKILNQKISNADFNEEQFKILKEAVIYSKEKYSKKDDICNVTKLPCCYCQPVCDSRK